MQLPISSNYPRARLGGEQDDQRYALLQLRVYRLLNTLIPIQIGFVGAVALTITAFLSGATRGLGPSALAFAVIFGFTGVMLAISSSSRLRTANGWSRGYAARLCWTIIPSTVVGYGIYLTWKLRRDVESELMKFGLERGMLGLAIDVAKAEEHLFNLRLKQAVPEGLENGEH